MANVIGSIFTDQHRIEAIREISRAFEVLRPPPKLTVSQWADRSRRLNSQSSAEPGQWNTSRAEYQRGIMDAFSDPDVREIVLMCASQMGKSEILLNIAGNCIENDPCPILILQPTVEMAQAFSKDRVQAGLILPSPTLSRLFKQAKMKQANNTTLHKIFPGGSLTLVGANSPSALASRPIRIVLCDEVDRYPVSAGDEGDPVALARRRCATFWNSKVAQVSTPTNRGSSRIEKAYLASDQRKYHVPCPHCGTLQELRWANVRWENDDPATAAYYCEHCHEPWTDAEREHAVRKGVWIAQAPFNGIAGFHLNGLYSPWYTIAEAVDDFLASRRDPMRLKTFVNTFLAETWEDVGESIEEWSIFNRAEDYEGIPAPVVCLTAGVDVQDDRIEIEVVGWGPGEESWQVHYEQLYGDPSGSEVWNRLDEILERDWEHPSGVTLHIAAACIDSGGHHTRSVYDYVKRKGHRRFAVKGVGGAGKPIVGRPSRNNIGKVPLYPIGVDTAKEVHFSRLRIEEPGPGYCHFPQSRDIEYFRQLTAEKRTTTYFKGRPRIAWVKTRERNEALDLRIYAIAAFAILNVPIDHIVRRFNATLEKEGKTRDKERDRPVANPLAPIANRVKARGFAQSWR
jgi:phage terminase large subunit GpA-like protein